MITGEKKRIIDSFKKVGIIMQFLELKKMINIIVNKLKKRKLKYILRNEVILNTLKEQIFIVICEGINKKQEEKR